MKNFVRFLALALALLTVISCFAACGGTKETSTESESESVQTETETETETEIIKEEVPEPMLSCNNAELIEYAERIANGVNYYYTSPARTASTVTNREMSMTYDIGTEGGKLVGSEKPIEFRKGEHLGKVLGRLNRITYAAVSEFPVGNFEAGFLFDGGIKHFQTGFGARIGGAFLERRMGGGNKDNAVETESVARGFGERQVCIVNGVETTAENPDLLVAITPTPFRRNRIGAARAKRIATQQAIAGKREAFHEAVTHKCLTRILRARRRKTAKSFRAENCMERRRNHTAIESNQSEHEAHRKALERFE